MRCLLFYLLVLLVGIFNTAWSNKYPSIAFYYGKYVPVDELHAFDVVVTDPQSNASPKTFDDANSHLYAYVSVGEWHGDKKIPNKKWIKASNRIWKSYALDQTNVAWRQYLINKIIEPLVARGYHGVFFDTVDSYHLFSKNSVQRAQQEQALIATIKAIKQRFPNLHLLLNRGFEIAPKLKGVIDGVAAESMYAGWDHANKRYIAIRPASRDWIRGKMNQIKSEGLWPIVIDYVNPIDRKKTRALAKKIKQDGYTPWVTNGTLNSVGIGSVEVVPRHVLIVYDSSQFPDITVSDPMRFMAFPLEQMGYVPRLIDVRKQLPSYPLKGRVAGVAVWINGQIGKRTPVLNSWLKQQVIDKIPMTLLGSLVYLEHSPKMARFLSLKFNNIDTLHPNKIVSSTKLIGYEGRPYLAASTVDVLASKGSPQLTIEDKRSTQSTPVSYMPWGGYALNPFIVQEISEKQVYWIISPFKFLKKSLKLKSIPVPDLTTKNGLRMLMAHIDGDGWVTKSEWFKGPIAARSLLDKVLMKYRIPTTVSIIEGELSPVGPYPKYSNQAMAVARDIYKLPWVEIATHTFSHPFKWRKLANEKAGVGYNLPIKGYRYSPQREITGSVEFINRKLAPRGKRCKVILWSGDTNPDEAALAVAYRDNLQNMNGGDTLITERNKTLTSIAPIGIMKGKYLQVYAPNQNENVYTNNWTGPYYGYRDAIQTFKLTNSPHRYKPIDIYYHTYSASKKSSLRALNQVYQWAMKQDTNKVYTSEYIKKAVSFYHLVLIKTDKGWGLRHIGSLKEFRAPESWGTPALNSNILGFNRYDHQSYIHVANKSQVNFDFSDAASIQPYIVKMNGSVLDFIRKEGKIQFSLSAHEPIKLVIHGRGVCVLSHDAKVIKPTLITKNGNYHYHFESGVMYAVTAKCTT